MIVKPCFIRNPSPMRSAPAVRFSRNAVVLPRLTTSMSATPLPAPLFGRSATRSALNSTRPSSFFGALSMSAMTALRGSFGSTAKWTFAVICS